MFKENQNIDYMFKWIKRATLVIVVLYMLFCWMVIRKSYQGGGLNKSSFFVIINRQNSMADAGVALQSVR